MKFGLWRFGIVGLGSSSFILKLYAATATILAVAKVGPKVEGNSMNLSLYLRYGAPNTIALELAFLFTAWALMLYFVLGRITEERYEKEKGACFVIFLMMEAAFAASFYDASTWFGASV